MATKLGGLLKKKMAKSNIGVGFDELGTWIPTGSYVLNNIISGDFHKGFPLGKSVLLAGESGAGKSLIAASMAKCAQDAGVYVVFLDTERALDESFLSAIGVDTADDKMEKYDIVTIEDAKKAITDTLKIFEDSFSEDDRPELLFVIDSLGMMLTSKEEKESDAGIMKGDMGQRAKQLRHFYRGITSQLGKAGAGLISTQHTWSGSDMYGNPITKVNGGEGQIYASSVVLMIGKKELKESAKAETDGVLIRVKCTKTRFTKPFRKIELTVPWETGIDPYSGLLDAFVNAGIVTQGGSWYTCDELGKKFQRKNSQPILDELLKMCADTELNNFDTGEEDIEGESEILMETSK